MSLDAQVEMLRYFRESKTYTAFQLDIADDNVHSSDFESIVKSYIEALDAGGRIELLNLELFPPLPTMFSFLRNKQSLTKHAIPYEFVSGRKGLE
jgi:hypothetical protein